MKTAVFKIACCRGIARLICVQVSTLHDAVELEESLRQELAPDDVELLGRFDEVLISSNMAEFLDLILEPKWHGNERKIQGRLLYMPKTVPPSI